MNRETEAIDAAVAGDRSDPELTLLVEEARSAAPRMTPAFAARLDDAVAAGFPRPARRRRLRLTPAVGLAGAAALAGTVAAIVVAGGGRDHRGPVAFVAPPATTVMTAEDAAAPRHAAAERVAARRSGSLSRAHATVVPLATLAAPPGEAPSRPTRHRVQQHAAQVTLATPAAKLEDTADGVLAVTDRLGGYVQTSDVSAHGGAGEATFDLRIPSSRLGQALAALSRLGHVRSRSEQVQDITRSYDAARARLHDLEAERQGLLRALASAATTQQIESVKAQLRIVGRRIASADGALGSVRHRADYSRVDVTVLGQRAAAAHHGGGGTWTPGRALHDAGRVLAVAAGALIVAAAAAVPLGLVALLALLAARAVRRRRREAALDGSAAVV